MNTTLENDLLFDDAAILEAALDEDCAKSIVKNDCDCSN
jgi:hypothetical protein